MEDLGTLGGSRSWATVVNDAGKIMGTSEVTVGANYLTSFLWEAGSLSDSGDFYRDISDLNESGRYCGRYHFTGGTGGFLYDGASILRLPFSDAMSMNDNGWLVGGDHVLYQGYTVYTGARLYIDGTTCDVNSLLDDPSPPDLNYANAINNLGQIIARGTPPGGGEDRWYLLTIVPEPSGMVLLLSGAAILRRRR